jgi:hypothetical protein
MTGFLRWNAATYRKLLVFYPEDLRHEFAAEMTWAFAESAAEAWREKGAIGVIQVWWCVLHEALRIAVPYQFENSALAVPALAFAFGVGMFGAEMLLALRSGPAALDEDSMTAAFACHVLLPSAVLSLVGFTVALAARRNPPASLRLGPACARLERTPHRA